MVTVTLGLTTHSAQGLNWWQSFCGCRKWMATRAGSIHLIKLHKLWERIHLGQPRGCTNGLMCSSRMRKICLLTNMADLHHLCLMMKIWGKISVYTCNLRGNLSAQWTLYIFWTPLRRLNLKKSISECTAQWWMHKMGYQWKKDNTMMATSMKMLWLTDKMSFCHMWQH